MMERGRDVLLRLGAELRRVFVAERHAIATLDHARLEELAKTKEQLAHDLAALARIDRDPECRELFAALRIEAHATAMLATTASAAIRALLGYDTSDRYDRRARRIDNPRSGRILRAT